MKHTYIDIDDTLLFTSAKVRVEKDGELVKNMSNHEYYDYELKSGESFDYSEFVCSKKFATESVPNVKMLTLVKEIYKTTEKGVHEMSLLTARRDLDNKQVVVDYLRSEGLDVGHWKDGKIHIIRCGNTHATPHIGKIETVLSIMSKRTVTDIDVFDDSVKNLTELSRLRNMGKVVNLYLVDGETVKEFDEQTQKLPKIVVDTFRN